MQVSVENLEGLARKLTVAVPAQEVDSEVERRIADAAKTVRLDGFRPGKVPRKVVHQRFGAALRQEVVAEVAQKSFQEAVTQQSLVVVGDPAIEPTKNDPGHDLEYTATFEVYPDVELCTFSDIKVSKPVAEVTDDDVSAMIAKLRDQQASWRVVERAAVDGDQLNIDFVGTRDGEVFDGGSAEGTDLELGSGRMIAGFESGLIGVGAGDVKELALQFPEDYHAEDLRSANVTFKVTVNTVSEKVLPELDDAFFALFDVSEGGVDAFKQSVRDSMEKQLLDSVASKLKDQVMDGLYENTELALPNILVSNEIKALKTQSMSRFGATGQAGFDESLLPDDLFKDQAQRRVALGVILNRVSEVYNIKPDRDKVLEFISELATSYDDPNEVRDYYLGDEERLQQIQMIVVEKLIVERVLEDAEMTENPCSYDDAVKAEQAG